MVFIAYWSELCEQVITFPVAAVGRAGGRTLVFIHKSGTVFRGLQAEFGMLEKNSVHVRGRRLNWVCVTERTGRISESCKKSWTTSFFESKKWMSKM